MKQIFVFMMLSSLLVACSLRGEKRLYAVQMSSGEKVYSSSQPRLNSDGFYEFYDVNQQKYLISKSVVLFVEPIDVKR